MTTDRHETETQPSPPPLSAAALGALDDVAGMASTAPQPDTADAPSLVRAADLASEVHRGVELLDHFRENVKAGEYTSREEFADCLAYMVERIQWDVRALKDEMSGLVEAARTAKASAGGFTRVLSSSQHDDLTVEISKARMASGLALGRLMDLHGPAIPPGIISAAEDIGYLVGQAQDHLSRAADTAHAAERVPADARG